MQVIAAAPLSPGLAAVAHGSHLAELDVDIVSHLEPVHRLPRHGIVRAIAWTPDERLLATGGGADWFGDCGSRTESIYLWDSSNGRLLARIGALFGVRSLAFSSDSSLLITAGMNGPPSDPRSSVDLWEAASGRHIQRFAELGTDRAREYFSAVAFVEGHAIASLSAGAGIRCWRVADGIPVEWPPSDPVTCLAFAGNRLVASSHRSIALWQAGVRLWQQPNEGVCAISADGRLVARGTGDRVDNHGPYENTAVEVLDASTGGIMARGIHHATPYSVSFMADLRSILAGGPEGELRLWALT